MLKEAYFCLNLLVQWINSVNFFLKSKSNYIEKLYIWYDVGYNIQNLNMAVCFEILIFFERSLSCEVVFLLQQPKATHTVTMFFSRFNHSSIVNNRHKQPLTSHIEPLIKSCRFITVSIKHGLRTTEYRLRAGYKTRTEV